MRIAIDLQSCQTDSRDRGIGRYALNLATALFEVAAPDDELVICIDTVDCERLRDVRSLLRSKGIGGRAVACGYPHRHFPDSSPTIQGAAGQLRAKFFESINPDFLLVTSLFEFGGNYTAALDFDLLAVPTAVIAYDIIPLLFPDKYLPTGNLWAECYRARVPDLKRFDLLLAISQGTNRDLVDHLAVDPGKIEVIGGGFDPSLLSNAAEQGGVDLLELGITKPFVLMVGNGDWRKNTIGAVHAFADLPDDLRRRHQLVLTQVGSDVCEALKTEYRHLQGDVVVLGKVSERVLGTLYSKCRVFFFPSYYEGFGLPVLEAMANGAPTLCSSRGALPEVVHTREMLFDPGNRAESSAILQRVLEDEGFRTSLSRDAKEHAGHFTWKRCASAALQAMKHHSGRREPGGRAGWPNESDISLLAGACQDAGENGLNQLRDSLKGICNGDRRRVLVDITEIVRLDALTGIQRVTRNFCAGLAEIARATGSFAMEPFVWTARGFRYAREFGRTRLGMACAGRDEPLEPRPSDLVFMLDSSWWSPERFDSLHTRTWELGGEVVWMVYDLIPLRHPDTCDPGMPPAFRSWLSHAVNTADGFVCISEATRADLELFMDETLSHAERRPWSRSVHLGSDFAMEGPMTPGQTAVDVVARIAGRPYFAALGTLEPRKEYGTILAAMEELWAQGADVALVMMGKKGWNVDPLVARIEQHAEKGRRLFWLEGATDGDVQWLLKGASGLIQASKSEGFGLPVVEAGSQGVPLFLSDIPVFHEIAGEEGSYFPVGDSKALASQLRQSIETKLVKRPHGIHILTWRQSAAILANVLFAVQA